MNNLHAAPPYSDWYTAAAHIQDAINDATDGDLIWVGPGTYTVPTNALTYDSVTNVVDLRKAVTLRSVEGPANTRIDGQDLYRGMYVYPPSGTQAVVVGFTIHNGRADWGAGSGGGIYLQNQSSRTVVLRNSVIESNTAGVSGGGIYLGPGNPRTFTAIISNCVVRLNNAGTAGGGISADHQTGGYLHILNSEIIGNTSAGNWSTAGGVNLGGSSGETLVEQTLLAENDAGSGGRGGAFYLNSSHILTLRSCMINANQGRSGNLFGAICLRNSCTLTLQNCTFNENGGGYAIYFFDRNPSTVQGYNTIMYNDTISYSPGTEYFENSCRYFRKFLSLPHRGLTAGRQQYQ
ncbi:MAG: right-handed parallel beta-helix repeat-containing protein [Lentisphaerae bacterium]|nr:right-handed parallel beta-helix repeat-containing protein [Lentisphaerota bacterium]